MIDTPWEELVIKRTKNKVTLELTEKQMRELHDDADYYATSGSYRNQEWLGFISSARAVRNAVAKRLQEIV